MSEIKRNGLITVAINSEIKQCDCTTSILSCIASFIITNSLVVAYLDYKVIFGTYSKSNGLRFPKGDIIDQMNLIKIRVFNKDEELYLWKTGNEFKGRYRKDLNGNQQTAVDSFQVIFGTDSINNENSALLIEKRGTELTLPVKGIKVDDKENRVFIKVRNYISFNENLQAEYNDSRFIGFTDKNMKELEVVF